VSRGDGQIVRAGPRGVKKAPGASIRGAGLAIARSRLLA